MTHAEMWKICGQVALLLDLAGNDWRVLARAEETLRPVAIALGEPPYLSRLRLVGGPSWQAEPGAEDLGSSLNWVRRHLYDALESELYGRMDTALHCAMRILDRLEASQPTPTFA